MKLPLIAALSALLVGCASDGVPLGVSIDKVSVKAYEGPDRPVAELALLKPLAAMNVIEIDGNKSFNASTYVNGFRYVDYDMAVTPGHHTLLLEVVHGGLRSKEPIRLPIEVKAGRKYLIRSISTQPLTWQPALEDVTDRPERWCIFANDRPEFKGC
ncbi:MAG TPA: hypothetical protein H9903_02360 [Candidatus Aquabacterium excrementipullorum]|nr:hypothetical protein [Candidatus Aquabacterium excrementipullorum]